MKSLETERTPTAISLFSGAGGMDLGVMQAGFNVLACIELDPNCCKTLRSPDNVYHRRTRIIESDIRNVDPSELMKELQLAPGELDLLFGGSPCQSFSQIGKQCSLNDDRGPLLFEMIRFARAFQPKSILIEQVKGLLNAKDEGGQPGGVFRLLLTQLDSLDYVPKWKVVNAAEYGIPQIRQRIFIVATKKPNEYLFPVPTHGPKDKMCSLFPLQPFVTVGEALIGLGKPSKKGETDRKDSHIDVTPKGDRDRIHGVPEGKFLAGQLHLPETQRKNLTKKDTTKYLRTSREKPSNTLRGGEIFFHPTEDRYLTPREYMRIHGYPDDYYLCGPIRSRSGRVSNLDQHRQVANSVPPLVAKKIAHEIKELLLRH